MVERAQGVMSDEHFTVDGTLIEAWASQKSFQRKDGGGTDGDGGNFRGQERKNDTHASKTDPDARQYRKSNGAESRLASLGHLLIDGEERRTHPAAIRVQTAAPVGDETTESVLPVELFDTRTARKRGSLASVRVLLAGADGAEGSHYRHLRIRVQRRGRIRSRSARRRGRTRPRASAFQTPAGSQGTQERDEIALLIGREPGGRGSG